MSSPGGLDFPEGFEAWPRQVQERWLADYHALYFPKLRWWDKPETDEEDSGPRPKQLPPDHPRHGDPDKRGYRCGCVHKIPDCQECPPCPGNPEWSTWLMLTARGCVAEHTRVYLPLEGRHERIDVLAAAGKPVTVLALTENGPRPAVTDGAPFFKGIADLYEVTTDDGQVITVTDQHRFLTPQGWRRLADVRAGQLLAAGAPVPQEAVSAGPSESRRDGQRSWRTVPGSTGRYPTYPGSCGQLPLPVSGSGRASSPSRDGADGRSRSPRSGDPGSAGGYTPPRLLRSRPARSSSSPAAAWLAAAAGLALLADPGSLRDRIPGWSRFPGMTASGHEVRGDGPRGYLRAWPRIASAAAGQFSHTADAVRLRPLAAAAGSSARTPRHLQPDPAGSLRLGSGPVVRPARSARPSALAVAIRRRCAPGNASRSAGTSRTGVLVPGSLRQSDSGRAPLPLLGRSTSLPHLEDIRWARIVAVRPAGTTVFYDMHVPGPENYAAEGFWNHNTGKTKAGSNWVLEMALTKPNLYVGLCAPTHDDIRSVCIEGDSGILAEARRNGVDIPDKAYNKNRQEIELPNGSRIRGFSAEKPESIRGENLSYVWFDELAMIRYFQFYHEGLQPALRKGENPRLLITTTPKRVRLIRDLIEESRQEFAGTDGGPGTGVHMTEAISAENIHFARKQRERLERKYAGNPVMLAQELRGEMLGEVDGALFPVGQFNETRIFPGDDSLPQWRRVVVAIDPATTSKDSSDESGIVVMAEGADGDFYCLEDCSGKFAPDQQMRVVAEAFYRNAADCVVGEVNMTGDYMRALLSTVDSNIPLRTVHGMKGKIARAQGPSSLFMQGRIHMVGDNFLKLEDQLSAMAEGDDRSRMKDDRADAFVWAMIHLAGTGQGSWAQVYGFRDCTGCGARVNEDKDQRCANCGALVTKMPPKHAGGRPAQVPWSVAYLKTCTNEECGKTYPPREPTCPHCSMSPESYMRKALAMSTGQGGWHSYTGRDWMAGRRI